MEQSKNTSADNDAIVPVILCGGSGTRLWPRSRKDRPKPFLPLIGERSLFEGTLDRVTGEAFASPIVVGGKAHQSLIQAQSGNGVRRIVEPSARNTAPAIALAAHMAGGDTVLLVCPSDHHIADVAAFRDAVAKGAKLARAGRLVAFGIDPTGPETGYGYIRRGDELGNEGFAIAQFVEKPDRERAIAMLAGGDHAWNGGIFMFRADTFLDELARHRPEMARAAADAFERGTSDDNALHPDPEAFDAIQGESVDYAVMEQTRVAAMVPVRMGWSDIGNWQALHEARDRDEEGNTVGGRGDLAGCRNVIIESDGPRVSVIGLENIAVVVDGDEVLVTRLDASQDVGKLPGAKSQ